VDLEVVRERPRQPAASEQGPEAGSGPPAPT
jgi:hypothetical protein